MPWADRAARLTKATFAHLHDAIATVPDVGGAPREARVMIRERSVEVPRGDGFVAVERRTELTIPKAEMPVRTQGTPIWIGEATWYLDQILDDDGQRLVLLVR